MNAGPLQVTAELLSSKKVGPYHHVTLVAPGVAERFRPGSLLSVAVGGELSERLARRTLPIARARATGAYGGTVEVVVAPEEPGERWLVGTHAGTKIDVVGPLGRPFALPKSPVPCLLVGEAAAAAPLLALAERLRERFCEVHFVLGAEREAEVYGALEARRVASSVTVVTADGSLGVRGRITDVLAEQGDRTKAAVIYAAGPDEVLAQATAVADSLEAWSQTAMSRAMPCGTGLCQTCLVPVVGADGVPRLARICTEGPVFRGDRVDWESLAAGGAA
jgi:dihydroorotate dehydrogenase electron transfer subunit